MSLRPVPAPEVPEATARVARAAFPKGCLAIRIRDELGVLIQDADFAAAFPVRGGPGLAPGMLAVVSVMQFAERLTDRQAADAVRGRIDWKYLLRMQLEDEGFHFSVLSGFRERLVDHNAEQIVLDRLLHRLSELGFLRAGGRGAHGCHPCPGIGAGLEPAGVLHRTLRCALEALSIAHPDWLIAVGIADAFWQDRYGQRSDSYRLPKVSRSVGRSRSRSVRTASSCWRRSTGPGRRSGCGSCRRCRCHKPRPSWSGRMLVLVQGAAESISSPDGQLVQLGWFGDRLGEWLQGCRGVWGAVWPVLVEELLVLAECVQEMGLVPDQGAVQELFPAGADPPFHDRVHAWHADPVFTVSMPSWASRASRAAG